MCTGNGSAGRPHIVASGVEGPCGRHAARVVAPLAAERARPATRWRQEKPARTPRSPARVGKSRSLEGATTLVGGEFHHSGDGIAVAGRRSMDSRARSHVPLTVRLFQGAAAWLAWAPQTG